MNGGESLTRRELLLKGKEAGITVLKNMFLCQILTYPAPIKRRWPAPINELPKKGDTINPTDNIYFSRDRVGLGKFLLGMNDFSSLAKEPEFGYYGENTGGFGKTLEIISYTHGIYLRWVWNGLVNIIIGQADSLGGILKVDGWRGKIEGSNIGLGSSLDEFLSKYPDAKKYIMKKHAYGYEGMYRYTYYPEEDIVFWRITKGFHFFEGRNGYGIRESWNWAALEIHVDDNKKSIDKISLGYPPLLSEDGTGEDRTNLHMSPLKPRLY